MNDDFQTSIIKGRNDRQKTATKNPDLKRWSLALMGLYLLSLLYVGIGSYAKAMHSEIFRTGFLGALSPVAVLSIFLTPFFALICLLFAFKYQAAKMFVFPLLAVAFVGCCLSTFFVLMPKL